MKVLYFLMTAVIIPELLHGQEYEDAHAIFKELLNSSRYHPDVIPILNQSQPISVNVDFNLISIISVDDITQAFTCNGAMTFTWMDERLTWDPEEYGGKEVIHPVPKLIWRPRVVLINTLTDRDLFGDDISPTYVTYDGFAQWVPGALFQTSCSLSLLKYPFDEQVCSITMVSMGLSAYELVFTNGTSDTNFYSENGEWQLLETGINTSIGGAVGNSVSRFEVYFKIKRRPTIYLLNIVMPVVFLSLLNMLVFCIPVDSGEKISYGITVVLAISVFLSLVSEMLPRSATEVPYVTIYLFFLYIVSVLTVMVTIVIVFLYHVEEKAVFRRKIANRFSNAMKKITRARQAIAPMQNYKNSNGSSSNNKKCLSVSSRTNESSRDRGGLTKTATIIDQFQSGKTGKITHIELDDDGHERFESGETENHRDKTRRQENRQEDEGPSPSKFKIIGDHIDFISFITFILIWLIITLWFFISVNVNM